MQVNNMSKLKDLLKTKLSENSGYPLGSDTPVPTNNNSSLGNVSKFTYDDVDNEGEMAKSQMIKTMRYAAEIMSMIDETSQLPAWVQAKLTKISDYIGAVKHYMEGKTVRHMVTNISESSDDTIKDAEFEKIMMNGMQYMVGDLKRAKLGKSMTMPNGDSGVVKKVIGNYDDKNGIFFRIQLDNNKWYNV